MKQSRDNQKRIKKILTSCKERDFLTEDPPIRGQNFVCLSFISPEDVLINKDVFCFHEFMKCFTKDVDLMFENLKNKFKDHKDVIEMIDSLKNRYDYLYSSENLQKEYDFFKEQNSTQLDKIFLEKNDFKTNIRGIKIRGTYDTEIEARNRAQELQKMENKKHNILIAQVGCWCPWSPYPNEVKDQEHSNTILNTMMKKYDQNMIEKDQHHKERLELERTKQKHQETVTSQQELEDENIID